MAEPAEALKPAAVPKAAAAPANASPKSGRVRLDLATVAGLAVALSGILGGLLLEKGSIQDVAQTTAAMIVLGGTIGAVLVTTPMPVFLRALKGMGSVFFERSYSTTEMIENLIQFATKARKNGIVSLEMEAAKIPDPFLRKSLSLAVDGTDMQELRKMMEVEITLAEHVAEGDAKVWESAGGYAPTIGIIGAVMGLIQVMKHLEDIKEVGHGIAVAFVATLYGVGTANLFFLPAATKLRTRSRQISLMKEMILEGVVGIVEGLNPTLIRMKLEAFNCDAKPARPGKPGKAKEPGGPEAVKAGGGRP
ncbi:MAG TPA: flagellar motor protein [Bryobacteraceae bacterium]|nr:flagellar motor protein [Bryobacteraceae bacterium]